MWHYIDSASDLAVLGKYKKTEKSAMSSKITLPFPHLLQGGNWNIIALLF